MSGHVLEEIFERWEAVIGLEVHTHLATETKLFSPAPVRYGEEPNHAVHEIDLALPGVLPVLNERVVELAIRLGLAVHATVQPFSVFARKNYFYPDLPKGYQISQYELPVVSDGWIEVEVPEDVVGPARTVRIGITRAHLEEDAGKSIHDSAVAGGDDTHIDLNRCGVPLLEIVSEPDLRSPEEAGAYLRTLRSILRHTGVSEADMEKGQFRCDANVSLRPRGQSELGTRTELKNLNSFRFVESAIAAEIERQAEVLEAGGKIVQATLGYEGDTGRISIQRVKESASDYRYFPDPDLIPLEIAPERIEEVRARMPELPEARRTRFEKELGLPADDARQLVSSRAVAELFEGAVAARREAGADAASAARSVANWMLRDVAQLAKEREQDVDELALTAASLAALVGLVDDGRLTARSARELLPVLADAGGDPEALMRERGLEAVQDTGLIDGAVDETLAAHPEEVQRFRDGDQKVLNFLMGQVMKRTRGKADPGRVRQALADRLNG
ncbi:MAG: Asp-tRNA(Asn)/Glu-tRNA(Gln) amidotransferase subunit GatB [Myxococcota bacterium]